MNTANVCSEQPLSLSLSPSLFTQAHKIQTYQLAGRECQKPPDTSLVDKRFGSLAVLPAALSSWATFFAAASAYVCICVCNKVFSPHII